MSEAFISYSRADSAFADRLSEDLEKRGIPVWIDRESIEGGAAWRASISQAIRSCCAFILILSPRSTQSPQVSKELSVAETHNRLIIPVVLEACDIPPGMELQLAELHWISFTELSYDAALERLTRVIKDARSRATGVAAPSVQEAAHHASPAPVATVRPVVSNEPSRAAGAGSSRKWLLAGTAAIAVAGASLAAFRYTQEPGSTPRTENAARADDKARRAEPVAAPGAPVEAVAVSTDSKSSVTPPAPPLGPWPGAKDRAETQASNRAAPPKSAPSGAERGATRDTVQQPLVVPSDKPLIVARADPAPAQAPVGVVGNSRTLLYHFPDCPGYSRVSAQARMEFASAREAERAGYKLSDNCADPSGGRAAAAVIANSRTRDYFLPHCSGYGATRPEYRVPFDSVAEAERAGYRRNDKCSQVAAIK